MGCEVETNTFYALYNDRVYRVNSYGLSYRKDIFYRCVDVITDNSKDIKGLTLLNSMEVLAHISRSEDGS